MVAIVSGTDIYDFPPQAPPSGSGSDDLPAQQPASSSLHPIGIVIAISVLVTVSVGFFVTLFYMYRARRKRAQEQQNQQEQQNPAQHDARRDRRSGREEGAPASDTWWTASPRSSTDGDLEKPLPSYHPEGVPEKKKQFVGHTVETFFHTATDRSRIGV